MAIEDKKKSGLNISLKQIAIILAVFALCLVAIYTNALTIGYIIVTLALCAFFLAVAFDVGIRNRAIPGPKTPDAPRGAPQRPIGGRSARSA